MKRQHAPKTSQTHDRVARWRGSSIQRQRAQILHLIALERLGRRLARIEERVCREDGGPAALPAACSFVPETSRQVFRGVIQGDMLADMLQLVSVNAMRGIFTVTNGSGSIELYCDEGRICHAAGLGMSGESAVHAVLTVDQGTYSFRETKELPTERTVTKSTQFLILEALRRVDRGRAG